MQNRLVKMMFRVSWISITSSSQGDSGSENGIDREQENMTDSAEGEVWGPSYLKLDVLFSFPKFCDRSYSTRTHSQASDINIEPRLL